MAERGLLIAEIDATLKAWGVTTNRRTVERFADRIMGHVVHGADGPTLYVVSCERCGALQGTPAGDMLCPEGPTEPNLAFPEDPEDLGHDWCGMHEWPLRACRVCHCTDLDCRGCIERTGEPCSWVPELETNQGPICSACVEG